MSVKPGGFWYTPLYLRQELAQPEIPVPVSHLLRRRRRAGLGSRQEQMGRDATYLALLRLAPLTTVAARRARSA
ncbi:hypothetical protein NDU88_007310 [Pleurodeles waltl]|uniref:Uncharacterized protein n=1 Tax=Pleurodeles waltl TaxID=8319 RepID=A0AAV7U0W1_PLEWA|nr:hypothetical protein NDU88_007310 [Pleurodeles waltl]